MIPAAVSKLLDACGVVFTVDHDNRGGYVATARNADDPPNYTHAAPGATAREAVLDALEDLRADAHVEDEAVLDALEDLRADAHVEDDSNTAAAAQLTEDGASAVRVEAAIVRAATWRVRAATLAAVCREASKLWPEVSL